MPVTRPSRTAALLAAALLLATPLAAQGPGGHGGPPGGMRMGARPQLPFPDQLEGPPTPSAVRIEAGLADSAFRRYDTDYAAHMAATSAQRDSVRRAMGQLREAFELGDREGARRQVEGAERLWKKLAKADEQFEKSARERFSKDERTRYDAWRKKEREAIEAERRERMGGMMGGPPPR